MPNQPSEKFIEIHEGSRFILSADHPMTLRELYIFAVNISGVLKGKLVVCTNFLPGTTLDIETRWRVEDGMGELAHEWQHFQSFLLDWVDKPSIASAALLPYTTFELWRGKPRRHDTPAIEIVRKLAWDTTQPDDAQS